MNTSIKPTPVQSKILAFRKHANIANVGGRGGGKSFALMLDALDHIREYQTLAKPLLLRESHAGLQQLSDQLYLLGQQAFGTNVTQNRQLGTMSFPSGATVTLSNIGDIDSYAKTQGKSFSFLGLDEAGNYPLQTFEYVNLIRSNLRVPPGMRPHVHLTANPHGRAHSIILKRFINRAPWFQPYHELTDDPDSPIWVNATSTYTDNPFIDQKSYLRNLKAATQGNQGLERAWVDGEWSHFSGGMFDNFEPGTHVRKPPLGSRMHFQGAMDYGISSPSVLLLLGELLDPVADFRPGDIFVIGEADTCPDPNALSTGDGSPPTILADMAKGLMLKYGADSGTPWVIDDFRGMNGPNDTLVNLFSEMELWAFRPRTKNRTAGWSLIRQLFNCVTDGSGPGLFISPDCPHLIETLQEIPRDDLRPDEIARRCPIDHHADSLRMGLDEIFAGEGASSGQTSGGY